ncbi:MAG: restriction endonuclease subunit S [Planctomycetales bacterium]|nr:restriction endonuclease subunit S [Planctomycetales bacterium]
MANSTAQSEAATRNNGKLPSGWSYCRFEEFAQNVAERVDPLDTDVKVYIGLEHLDCESLKIRRWGSPDDVIGQKLKFAVGDLIFGRRRAYQRKLGLAETDGICSAHAMVIRAKVDVIDSEFLPFFIQSDVFMERALSISVGSLSPTINWKTLRHQEFPLPSRDEQRRIAKALWLSEDYTRKLEATCEAARIARNTCHRHFLRNGTGHSDFQTTPLGKIPSSWKVESLGECCEIANRLRKPINAATRAEMQGPYPYHGPTGVLDHLNEYRVEGEYVLLGEDGDHFLKYNDWNMTQFVSGRFNVNNHAHIIKGGDDVYTKWVFHYFKHRNIKPYLARQGAGRLKLKKATLEKIPLPVPPHDEQEIIIRLLDECDAAHMDAVHQLETQRLLHSALREALLTPDPERGAECV